MMLRKQALIDSGFLFALYNRDDSHHADAVKVIQDNQDRFIVPYVVLTEVGYLFRRAGGSLALQNFLVAFAEWRIPFEVLTESDLLRMREILKKYADANFDFVDCCLMAMTERMNITRVCTFDRRDFSMFVPKHVPHLDLLP